MLTNEKWKKAVVHLECVANDFTKEVEEKLHQGQITNQQLIQILTREKRSQGTAVFLKEGDKQYLVTAKHVVEDRSSGYIDYLCNPIFLVPRYGQATEDEEVFIMNINAGVTRMRPFALSNDEEDLAVISLNSTDTQNFAEALLKQGYEPIDITEVQNDSSVLTEGDDVFAIGFPNTSLLQERELTQAEIPWKSKHISSPLFSFGKVAMNPDLNFIWVDISIYPGNSGGPVIKDGKLIGIVSGQSVILGNSITQSGKPIYTGDGEQIYSQIRIPFAKVIKSHLIFNLLEQLNQKEII
ncbi:serine protease [Bacillus halotolerans]|uniref:S1 family peptidase n=1 Tax=Bacillus halotolerans TaxID=260554 RepID=UPI00204129CF|nr:serine protease [Bacillus halotolerans]MCM3353188.1 serine protease [Bacillus halotolerans]